MAEVLTTADHTWLEAVFARTRALTERLAAPLSPEDQTVQSMPDASPTKWHRAHTTWFFETFVLEPSLPGYRHCHPGYGYLFNSYYEGAGARYPRHERGLVSRPGVEDIVRYREHVDSAMADLFARAIDEPVAGLVELGVHHEQQHQELLLMDIKHVLSRNPLLPAYVAMEPRVPRPAPGPGWVEHGGGLTEVGHTGDGFSFDNERPRHRVYLEPFALSTRPVTVGEWTEFIEDGGYRRAELWLSDGWAISRSEGWTAPLYWDSVDDEWHVFTLGGSRTADPSEPVCHVSYYEADAFARWAGARLPTEEEWETAATDGLHGAPDPHHEAPLEPFLDTAALHPAPLAVAAPPGLACDVWQWTSSAYSPYPGFEPATGAVGEYNGKFMVNQYVLRGGSCVTPRGHARPTYRNFFSPAARWAFSGLRLARNA